MNNKCLYCCEPLDVAGEYHEKCSLEFFGSKTPPIFSHSLEQMVELAKDVVERSIAVPGVQPKLSLSLVSDVLDDGGKSNRLTVVGMLGGNYIFKPPTDDYPHMPENEHLTMHMAAAFGIPVVKSSLIRMQSGELGYITKRIDRTDKGEKIHMIDMFQITEATDKYKSSLERIGKALHVYSDNTFLDVVNFFELTLFCFLTGNNDMHLKNFSMITNGDKWFLAPAYDLLNVTIANPGDPEELALTLDAKKRKLSHKHFNEFGQRLMLNERQINATFKSLSSKKERALEWIEKSFLNEEYKQKYRELFEERYQHLFSLD